MSGLGVLWRTLAQRPEKGFAHPSVHGKPFDAGGSIPRSEIDLIDHSMLWGQNEMRARWWVGGKHDVRSM